MKKLVIALCFVLLLVSFVVPTNLVAKAESGSFEETEYINIIKEGDLLRFYDRTAGTEGEKSFALYLQDRMIELGYLPNGSDKTNKSFDYFTFTSSIDGKGKTSQNVRFIKKGTNAAKKVLICTSYDNAFGFVEEKDCYTVIGEDAGLGGVVCALSIANALKDIDFEFDIEFVFFGAEYHNRAGGNEFALGINKKQAEKIAVAINIDDLSEKDLYFYDAEKQTKYGDEFKLFVDKNFDGAIKKYEAGNSVILQECEAYPFLHRGLMSDNAPLIASGVRAISLFSASKDGFWGNEYYRAYSTDQFDGEKIPDSINSAAVVSEIVVGFVANTDMSKIAVGNGRLASVWTNGNIVLIILFVLILVVWCVYYLVYFKLKNNLKRRYTTAEVVENLNKLLDDEIKKSNNFEIKQNEKQIKEMFSNEIKKRIDDKDSDEE